MQRQAYHTTAAWILPGSQVTGAPVQPLVLVGDEWGDFLLPSRDEEPREKAQNARLVGRCMDNNEQLRTTPLFSPLRAAGLEDQYTDGFLALLLVTYIYISVTDANNKMRTETTNETDDHFQTLRSS